MKRLTTLFDDMIDMCKNYPLVLLGTAVMVILGIYLNHQADQNSALYNIVFRILASIGIILPTLLGSYLYFTPQRLRIITQLIILWLGILYYCYLGPRIHTDAEAFVMTNVVLVLLSLSTLFISHRKKAKQEDKQLRFADTNIIGSVIIAGFFTWTLCLGIAAIFQSLEYLFDIAIQREYMRDIVILIIGLWWVTLFLKRITYNTTYNYPKLLEIFAKYVLASLVGIYTLILLAYGLKILMTGIWPKGEVVYMVMWYFVLGFLTTLALYPLTNTPNYNRVRKFNLWFYISSLPILLLGFMSLHLRVDQYGWTINRYLVVSLLCFFACLGIFNVLYKNYKTLWLFSLLSVFCVVVLLPFVGFKSVIRHHQDNKIHTALAKSNALNEDGTLNPNINLTGNDADQIYSSLDYITESFEKDKLQQLDKYVSLSGSTALVGERRTDKETIMNAFGLSGYVEQNGWYVTSPTINRYNDNTDTNINIDWFKNLSIIDYYDYEEDNSDIISVRNNGNSSAITVYGKTYTISFDSLINKYASLLEFKNGNIHTETINGDNYKAIITSFSASKDPNWTINSYKMYLLTK